MEVATSGVSNGVSTPDAAASVDSGAVIQYLTEVLQVTLGALKSELESAGSLLSDARYHETAQRCMRFATESQVALYVQKDIAAAEEANGDPEGTRKSMSSAATSLSMLADNPNKNRLYSIHITSPPRSRPRRLPSHR